MTDTNSGYSGRDNLEIMQEAENYNNWLALQVHSRVKNTDLVADFGAGSGTFAKALVERGLNVLCVEPDEILRCQLTAVGLKSTPSVDALSESTLDAAYSFNVLEHIQNDAGALSELARRMKPGATLIVFVPAFQILYSTMDTKVGHLRRYRRRSLAHMVQSCGFTISRARYADCLGFFATLAYKLMGSREGTLNPMTIRTYDKLFFPLSRLLDGVFGIFFGKNVLVIATRD